MQKNNKSFKTYARLLIISLFLAVPLFSSFISTIHLVELFALGNLDWISIILACVYEVGSIAAFIVPFVLTKSNKTLLWSIFILLVTMQILGNVYYGFAYINFKLSVDPNWLSSFKELMSYFIGNDQALIKIVLSCLIGIPIPTISLFFLKSTIQYINPDINENIANDKRRNTNFNQPLQNLVSTQKNHESDKEISLPVTVFSQETDLIKNELENVKNADITTRGTSESTQASLYGTGTEYFETNNSSDTTTDSVTNINEEKDYNENMSIFPGYNPPIIVNNE